MWWILTNLNPGHVRSDLNDLKIASRFLRRETGSDFSAGYVSFTHELADRDEIAQTLGCTVRSQARSGVALGLAT
jgi:hypothetical protein